MPKQCVIEYSNVFLVTEHGEIFRFMINTQCYWFCFICYFSTSKISKRDKLFYDYLLNVLSVPSRTIAIQVNHCVNT